MEVLSNTRLVKSMKKGSGERRQAGLPGNETASEMPGSV